jgi:diguanylate cyclase (GGDEF)-like protein
MDYYTFIPIKNPTSKKVVAAIILETKTYEINKRYEYAQLQFFLGLIAIILVFLFLYREYTSKRKLELLSNKTRRILDTQDSIVIITNAKRLIDVNKRFLTFFGFSSERTLSTNDYCICQNFIKKEHYYSRSETTSNWVEEIMQLNPNERIVLMKDTHEVQHGFSVSTSKYAQDSFIITFNDITYTIEEQLRLKQKVYLDKLTGAYNREFFHTNIEVLIQSCNTQSKELGLIIFDIDHFKAVNDTYGHNKGDEVLISLSQCVQESIRANDFFIRWGGEEFIVLLCVKSAKEAARVAEILRAKIENLEFKDLERVTCSFGAILINKEQDIVANIERADKALYKAKESGRNRVILA